MRVERAVDMLSVSQSDKQSLRARMDAMGGESTFKVAQVKREQIVFQLQVAPRIGLRPCPATWLACRVSTLPQRAVRFHMQRRIGTNMVPDGVCTAGENQDVRIHSVFSWHNIWQWWPSCRVTGSF